MCSCPRVSVGLGHVRSFFSPFVSEGLLRAGSKKLEEERAPPSTQLPWPPRQLPVTAPHLAAQPQGWQFKPCFAWEQDGKETSTGRDVFWGPSHAQGTDLPK